ncbi:MAG: AcrR family transcriptional regulator [Thermoproteota archaeon]|jgi:AcrR family transcriptional regulator
MKKIIPQSGKDKTYWDILNAAISLDIQKGHLKWSLTGLSKKADVTRSLIYHYFGKEKLNILEEACLLFGEKLAGISNEYLDFYKENDFISGIACSRQILEHCPMLLPFYYLNRTKINPIGVLIREYEEKGIQKRIEQFPNLKRNQAIAIYTLQFGISTCPNLRTEDIQTCIEMIKEL